MLLPPIDLGRRQLRQALKDFIQVEAQLIIADDRLDRLPGALDHGPPAANVRHTGDVTITGEAKDAHGSAPVDGASVFKEIITLIEAVEVWRNTTRAQIDELPMRSARLLRTSRVASSPHLRTCSALEANCLHVIANARIHPGQLGEAISTAQSARTLSIELENG
jgi:hypothetical protein